VTEYALYLESGPQRRKTMVHVPALLGCMANGPTTENALAATPEAIRAYLRFLGRCGEGVDANARFDTRVAEHVTEGVWLGNGSPYVTFGPDLEPVTEAELGVLIGRLLRLREELAGWAETRDNVSLDAMVEGSSRSPRAILLHVLGPTAAYLSPVLGTIAGVSRLQTAAERGQIGVAAALRQATGIVVERLRQVTPDERSRVTQRPKEIRTLRKALRRMLEHDWEHLAELSRRPGGPAL
jgi:predicted RNase H-like HicB family nuclease